MFFQVTKSINGLLRFCFFSNFFQILNNIQSNAYLSYRKEVSLNNSNNRKKLKLN